MAGFSNGIMTANNVDFSGGAPPAAKVTLDGQLLIGATAAPNIRVATLTAGTGVTITNAAGSITIGLTGGAVAVETLTGNSGGAISPTANNINTIGSGSITIAGSGSTLTTQLTGLTNHAVLVGAGTDTITKLSVGTNGQVLIAATTADPAFATLTSTGGTIAFTLGANTLNLEAAAGGFTWVNQTADLNPLAKQHAYQANKAGTAAALTLPTGSTFGDTIRVQGFGATGWVLNAGTGQTIIFGSSTSTVAGSLSSTNQYDFVEVVCSSTTTTWLVTDVGGNITVA